MQEVISSMLMLVSCVIAGIVASVWHSKLKKEKIGQSYIILCIFYSFICLLVVNTHRCLIWRASELICYSLEDMLWIVDALLCMLSAFFVPIFNLAILPREIQNTKMKWYKVCIAGWCTIYCVIGIALYFKYRNVNSTIYHFLFPKYLVMGEIWFLVVLIVAYARAKRDDSKSIQIQDCLTERIRQTVLCDTRNAKQCIQEAQLIIFFWLMTKWIYPFWEIVLSNGTEWYFSIPSILGYCLLIYVILYAFLCIIFGLCKGKVWDFCLVVIFASGFSAYIQAMLLNSDLFMMDGSKLQWSNTLVIVNLLIWIIMFLVVFLLYNFLQKYWKKTIQFLSFMLLTMQLVAMISLIPQYVASENNAKVVMENYLSTDGMYEVGANQNIILFVLDFYDVEYMNEVLETQPDFLSPLEGFTYYPDNVSQFSRTWPSVTYLLTQQIYYREVSHQEYMDKAFSKCKFWSGLEEKGFQLGLFEEENTISASIMQKAKNYKQQGHSIEEKISFTGCLHAMMNVGHYRTMPYLWKNYYVYSADTINNDVIETQRWDYPKYKADDAEILAGLKEKGLRLSDSDKMFLFYHLTGAHAPYTLNEQGLRVKDSETTAVEQFRGCWQFVFKYLEELKRLDLYENSMIIVTADHGKNYMTSRLEEKTNPILFVKPSEVKSGELKISDMYASQEDILYTIAKSLGIENGLEGMDLLDTMQDTKGRIRYHYYDVIDGTRQIGLAPYEIHGSSLDFANWKETGEYIEFLIP